MSSRGKARGPGLPGKLRERLQGTAWFAARALWAGRAAGGAGHDDVVFALEVLHKFLRGAVVVSRALSLSNSGTLVRYVTLLVTLTDLLMDALRVVEDVRGEVNSDFESVVPEEGDP